MRSRLSRRSILKTAAGVSAGALAGCTAVLGDVVAVGSKRFTEQEILGYLALVSMEENTDIDVENEIGLGGTVQNFEALRENEIDLYWEYSGTAWLTLPPQQDEVIHDSDELMEAVREDFDEEHDLTFLEPAPFDNTYVITAHPDWVEETGVEALSELAEHLNDGNTDYTMVLNAEFSGREVDGWPALIEYYEFEDAAGELSISTVDDEVLYQVVGERDADIGVGFNTDPRIPGFDLEVLDDDEDFFPGYNPAPLISNATLNEHDELADVLNEIGPTLDLDTIREMNNEVANEGRDAQEVATEHLEAEGLI